jgi:hypothetical protein
VNVIIMVVRLPEQYRAFPRRVAKIVGIAKRCMKRKRQLQFRAVRDTEEPEGQASLRDVNIFWYLIQPLKRLAKVKRRYATHAIVSDTTLLRYGTTSMTLTSLSCSRPDPTALRYDVYDTH